MLMEQASDGIHTYDMQGNILDVNLSLCEMLGYSREELLLLNVRDLVSPEDLARFPIRFDELRSGRTIISERRLLRKDGTFTPVEISGKILNDGVLQAIVRDVSERKQAEEAIRQAHDELERRVEERTAELARTSEVLRAEIIERKRVEETLRKNEEARNDLLRQLGAAQEQERWRIARELHDQMGQRLSALMLGLKSLNNISSGRQPALEQLGHLIEITNQLAEGVHTLAWQLAKALEPDVAVMDVSMPELNGVKATEILTQECPKIKVLALTVHEDQGYLRQILKAGAAGYVLKKAMAEELIHAIRTVAAGNTYIDPVLANSVVRGYLRDESVKDRLLRSDLSARETEVLRLIAWGYSNKEISAQLNIGTKTVETYKARLMEKLELRSRVEIVQYALHQGWLKDS